jgi:hypothetical protein
MALAMGASLGIGVNGESAWPQFLRADAGKVYGGSPSNPGCLCNGADEFFGRPRWSQLGLWRRVLEALA